MKKLSVLVLQAGLFLTACGGYTYQSGGASSYTPTYTTSTATTTYIVSSSQAPSVPQKNEKEAVINYLKMYGTYSDGAYSVIKTSVWDRDSQWTVTDYISYSVFDDDFTSSVMMKTITSTGSVVNFGMASFKWGSFRYGNFLGQTIYTARATEFRNSFRFTVSFGLYPSFEITSNIVLESQYSSSLSLDASLDGDCVGRAINNFIKSARSMGATSALW